MSARPVIALGFALFLAAMVPAALACEGHAYGDMSGMEPGCGQSIRPGDCASRSALRSVVFSRGIDPPPAPVFDLPSLPAVTAHTPAPVQALRPLRAVPFFRVRTTLFAQAVLLRI